jgi:hypothetical protein
VFLAKREAPVLVSLYLYLPACNLTATGKMRLTRCGASQITRSYRITD